MFPCPRACLEGTKNLLGKRHRHTTACRAGGRGERKRALPEWEQSPTISCGGGSQKANVKNTAVSNLRVSLWKFKLERNSFYCVTGVLEGNGDMSRTNRNGQITGWELLFLPLALCSVSSE